MFTEYHPIPSDTCRDISFSTKNVNLPLARDEEIRRSPEQLLRCFRLDQTCETTSLASYGAAPQRRPKIFFRLNCLVPDVKFTESTRASSCSRITFCGTLRSVSPVHRLSSLQGHRGPRRIPLKSKGSWD